MFLVLDTANASPGLIIQAKKSILLVDNIKRDGNRRAFGLLHPTRAIYIYTCIEGKDWSGLRGFHSATLDLNLNNDVTIRKRVTSIRGENQSTKQRVKQSIDREYTRLYNEYCLL